MTDPTPEARSLAYAEGLGVNSVYDEARAARNELERKYQELHELKSRKRSLESLKVDHEMEVAEELRRTQPELSAAMYDKQIKIDLSNYGPLREVRDHLASLQGDIDLCEYEVSLIKADIEIAVARITELGGYLQFMAVIKGVSEARKAREANEKNEGESA